MLTVQTEKTRLESLLEDAYTIKGTGSPRQLTKITTQIKESRDLIAYLKTEPTEQYITAERDGIAAKLKMLEERYKFWNGHIKKRSFGSEHERRESFNRMYDVDLLNKRLELLNRILNN